MLKSELKIVQDASDLLLKDGLALEKEIRTMLAMRDRLENELRDERHWAKREIAKRDLLIAEMIDNQEKERRQLLATAEMESKINLQI